MSQSQHKPTVIWRLSDNKPGHEAQTLGLCKAIAKKSHCQIFDIPVKGRLPAVMSYLSSQWQHGKHLPMPDLIIGAGHRTHIHMLAAQKVYGGKTIVLMKPSLPASLFDLCIIPEHDNYQGKSTHITTKGVLNSMHAQGEHDPSQSLVMIGGPSKHFHWNGESILAQLKTLLTQNPDIHFTLTTSRRTPSDFISLLESIHFSNLEIVSAEKTYPGWVAEKLAASGSAWISEDSVSMVYEALTANVAVGVLNMPKRKENRISNGINKLLRHQFISRFDQAGQYKATLKPVMGFMESDRCANWILTNWVDAEATVTATQTAQISA